MDEQNRKLAFLGFSARWSSRQSCGTYSTEAELEETVLISLENLTKDAMVLTLVLLLTSVTRENSYQRSAVKNYIKELPFANIGLCKSALRLLLHAE